MSILAKLLTRPFVYAGELGFCLRVGATFPDKIRLALATLAFHLRAGRGRVVRARVRYEGHTADLRLRCDGGDVFIFHEVLMSRVYHVSPDWLRSEPRVIVDLGANVGLAALALAAQFPNARLVCVEPHPATANLLRHNRACLGSRAQVLEAAVSNTPGKMRLNLAAEHYNASLVRGGNEGIEVDTITMEDVMARAGITTIDVLKMDIEGAEKLILPARPVWLKQVGLLLAELHDGYGFAELERDVAGAGLRVVRAGVAQAVATRAGRAAD